MSNSLEQRMILKGYVASFSHFLQTVHWTLWINPGAGKSIMVGTNLRGETSFHKLTDCTEEDL